MSHGYNPAGNVSGGQWQAAYQQQGQAAQSAQPQGSQQYVAPQSAPASGYQGAGGYPQGGPQQYAQPQGNPQQYAGQQYPPPQSGQQYGGAQHAQPQQYAQPQQQGQQFVQSGQGGAPQVASQQYAGAQYAQPQQYAAPQSAPASGQGAGGYPQGNPQQYAQPQGNPQQYAGQQYPRRSLASSTAVRSTPSRSSTRLRSRRPRSRRAPNWQKTPERTIGYASRAGRTLPSSTARSASLGSRSSLCSLGSRGRTTCTTPRSNSALLLMSSCVQGSRWVPRHFSSSCRSPSSWSSSSAQTCDATASEARFGVIRASFLRPW